MSLRESVFRAVLLSAALTCSATSRLRADNATSVYGAFAFADSAGAYVLTLAPLRHPERVHVLLAGSGRQFPVAYDGNQKRSGADTGRQTGSNFANSAGQRFRILGGRVWGSETCFLATDSLVSVGRPTPLRSDVHPCVADSDYAALDHEMAANEGRGIRSCWNLASAEDGSAAGLDRIRLYEFAPEDTSYLARIALFSTNAPVLISDYPAESNDPSSVWRVDDDGKLPPEDFHVLFVIEGRSETFMAISWDGEEGQNINLLRSMGGEAFTGVAGAYRYWLSR